MRRAVATAMIAIMLVTAGCNGFLDSGNSTEGETPGTAPETTAPDTPAQTPTPTELEQEYIDSGNEFARVVGERLSKRFETSLVDGTGYRNGTFDLTVQISEGDPLYLGMMDATQTVAATLTFKTATDQSVAMADGTDGKVHFPETVSVDVLDPEGNYLGSFDIDPEQAFLYRTLREDRDSFATSVVDSLELEREYERGDHEPVWYLNRSNLVDFRADYIEEINSESNPRTSPFDKRIPTDNVTISPSSSELRHEFEWDDDEYGQFFTSAEIGGHTAYRLASNESWALPSSALTVYIHRDGDDFWSRMDVSSVYWILDRTRDNANLTAYYDSAETEFIDDEE